MHAKLIVSCIVLMGANMLLYAGGGKNIMPAATPVVPVEAVDFSGWYIGAGLVRAKLSACENSCIYEDVTYGLMIRGGYDFNRYIGIEGRYIYTSLGKGPLGGSPLMHAGIFLKPQLPLGERINLYGLLGYGYTKNLGNGGRLNYFDDGWGFSTGVGLEYRFLGKKSTEVRKRSNDTTRAEWRLFVEYQRLLVKSGVPDMYIVSFGVRRHF